ncbi:MAG: mechanosensitive ion channel [Methylococcaceae bacterium]|nr:MAG: mechanosensitive ion channel [Methylococcaceae bacterium]
MDFVTFMADVNRHAWHDELPLVWSMVIAIFVVAVLRLKPDVKKSVFITVAFFLLSLLGLLISGLIFSLGFESWGRALHETFIIMEGIFVIRLGGIVVFRLLLPGLRIRQPGILEDITDIIGYCAWLMVRLHYAGLQLSDIIATSAVITAILVFSMQDTLGNILGGLALQLDNSIDIGDWIRVSDTVGRVVEMRWRHTAIETSNWETEVIPNSLLVKSKFTVLGRRKNHPLQWRRWIRFNVGYATPPGKVINAVQNAVREARIANVAAYPQPSCVTLDFEASFIRYGLRYWLTELDATDSTDTAVRSRIYAGLQREDICFSCPEYNVHVTEAGGSYERAKLSKIRHECIQALRKMELFHSLTEDELLFVAGRLKYSPFAKGELITRQGDAPHDWLYILLEGQADVFLELPDGVKRHVGCMTTGNLIGEMGLMTGAARSATVIAKTDTMCYRLDKETFKTVLTNRPELAEELSRILVNRRFALDNLQQEVDAELSAKQLTQQQNSILERIRTFFGLDA